jgi:hypothetical protein
MKRKLRVALAVALVALIAGVTVSIVLSIPPNSPQVTGPPIQWVAEGTQANTTVNLPLNGTLVREYADHLLSNYNALLDGKQALWTDFGSIQSYFLLYQTSATPFNVYVARDNASANSQIEFLFARSPTTIGQVYPYENATGADLRPEIIAGLGQPTFLAYDWQYVTDGTILTHITTNSPVGVSYFPLVWITNIRLVYNNTQVDAKTAGQEIYDNDATNLNLVLNPPFPSWAWFWHFWDTIYGQISGAAGLISAIIGIYSFLTRPPKNPYKRRSRE